MKTFQHSRTPWRSRPDSHGHVGIHECVADAAGQCVICMGHGYDEGGIIANDDDRAFIVRACNNFEAMLQSIKDLTSPNYRPGIDVDIHQTAVDVIAEAEKH